MLAYYLITALHVLVCFILILVVLLQSGKGADLAGAFGGAGTQTAFGSRGPASFLSKLTTGAAVVFMITCLALSTMSTKREAKSILDSSKTTSAPAAPKAPTPAKAQTQAPSPEQIKQIQKEIERRQQEQKAAPAQAAPPPSTSQPAEKAQPAPAKPPTPEAKPPATGKKN